MRCLRSRWAHLLLILLNGVGCEAMAQHLLVRVEGPRADLYVTVLVLQQTVDHLLTKPVSLRKGTGTELLVTRQHLRWRDSLWPDSTGEVGPLRTHAEQVATVAWLTGSLV